MTSCQSQVFVEARFLVEIKKICICRRNSTMVPGLFILIFFANHTAKKLLLSSFSFTWSLEFFEECVYNGKKRIESACLAYTVRAVAIALTKMCAQVAHALMKIAQSAFQPIQTLTNNLCGNETSGSVRTENMSRKVHPTWRNACSN